MKCSHSFSATRAGERGSALIGVLLLLMMMSAVAAALGVSGHTETLVARNHQSAAQAQAAAEAGLNHATQTVVTYIFQWQPNGFASPEAVLDALLVGPDGASGTLDANADNGSLECVPNCATGLPRDTRVPIAGTIGVEYEARVMDEDDPDRGAGATQVTADPDAANNEDGNPVSDANQTLVVRAIGYAPDNTSVVLEALLSPLELPAIVANGDLVISGNATIGGTEGSVHANDDLTISGNSAVITGDATASATITCNDPCNQVAGTTAEGTPQLPVPTVRASDHRFKADFVLTSSGTMTDLNGNVLCSASPCNYWNFNAGTWTLSGNDAADGTYYVEGMAKVSGNAGTPADPIAVSIIAEGSIEISGNPDLMPDYPELLFVTDGDLLISGGIDTPLTAQGQMLVHEQAHISGNPQITGQLIVENVPSQDNLVGANAISGNPTIIYNGGLGTAVYSITAWRDVR